MSDTKTSGFVALYVSADKMAAFGYPFSVILEDNEVKAYMTSRKTWNSIEKNFNESTTEWGSKSYKPLVIWSEGVLDMAEQLGWVIVGGIGDE